MIVGIGTDVVQISRIEKIIKLYKNKFSKKILHESELEKMLLLKTSLHPNFLAKKFAAKEAISKAMGTGIGKDLGFKDIIIHNDSRGKPVPIIINNEKANHYEISLSVSDDYPIALAFAIISSKNNIK